VNEDAYVVHNIIGLMLSCRNVVLHNLRYLYGTKEARQGG
jgi:hypothetical protein